jgi:oxygen-independent coproporphyrinogen III oxidase
MDQNAVLNKIRNELFYGSTNYTKNQPDLFVPHHFRMLAPSEVTSFFGTTINATSEEEILIYIHLPYCFSECLFCNSFPLKVDKQVQQKYLTYLIKEIELYSSFGVFNGKKAKCISFGGGTPTTYSNKDIKKIIDAITTCIGLSENCSIATEAHPLTLEQESRIVELASIGFNRISVGCQTFDDDILSLCNRNNTPAQIEKIVKTAQGAGLMINIDMMTGLPGQSIEKVRTDLCVLEQICPDSIEYIRHEIVNPLITELYEKRPELIVDDDILFEMVLMTQQWMENNGYEQNGRFSSDKQWGYRYHWLEEMPIIAFGTRTRSYTKTICFDKHEDLATYSRMIDKGIPPIGRYIALSKQERMYRSLILSLQLKKGLNIQRFHDMYRENPFEVFGPLVLKLEDLGCLYRDVDSVRLTQYGAYFVEDVCDCIIDAALREESSGLVRAPHSGGQRFLPVPHEG